MYKFCIIVMQRFKGGGGNSIISARSWTELLFFLFFFLRHLAKLNVYTMLHLGFTTVVLFPVEQQVSAVTASYLQWRCSTSSDLFISTGSARGRKPAIEATSQRERFVKVHS